MRDRKPLSWKETTAICMIAVIAMFAAVIYSKYGEPDRDAEMAHLFKTGFSLSDVVPGTGKVESVSIALVPPEERSFFSKTIPQDWKRRKVAGGIEGRARLFVVAPAGGVFTITYFYSPETKEFRVLKIEDSRGEERQPNQALQTTSVTRSGFGRISVSDRQRRGV